MWTDTERIPGALSAINLNKLISSPQKSRLYFKFMGFKCCFLRVYTKELRGKNPWLSFTKKKKRGAGVLKAEAVSKSRAQNHSIPIPGA